MDDDDEPGILRPWEPGHQGKGLLIGPATPSDPPVLVHWRLEDEPFHQGGAKRLGVAWDDVIASLQLTPGGAVTVYQGGEIGGRSFEEWVSELEPRAFVAKDSGLEGRLNPFAVPPDPDPADGPG